MDLNNLGIIVDKTCAHGSLLPKIAFEGIDVATLCGLIAGLGIALSPLTYSISRLVEMKLSQARPFVR
jgi:hypothetical protein